MFIYSKKIVVVGVFGGIIIPKNTPAPQDFGSDAINKVPGAPALPKHASFTAKEHAFEHCQT